MARAPAATRARPPRPAADPEATAAAAKAGRAETLANQARREALAAERARALKVANERAKLSATVCATLGSATVIAGLIAPLFSPALAIHPATVAAVTLAAGLLYMAAHLILRLIQPED